MVSPPLALTHANVVVVFPYCDGPRLCSPCIPLNFFNLVLKCHQLFLCFLRRKHYGNQNQSGNPYTQALHSPTPWPTCTAGCSVLQHVIVECIFSNIRMIDSSMVTGAKASSRQTLLCPGFRDRLNEHSVFFGLFKLARSTVCPPAHDDWYCHYKTALVGTNVPTRPRTPAPSLYQLWLFLA